MQAIKEYEITAGDYRLKFLNIGAVITEFSYRNKNIVLSFESLESYRANSTFMGAIVGRSAGRIKDGKIAGWQLPKNQNNTHNLHGNELHYQFYDVKVNKDHATLILVDPEGGFPGNAVITVEYILSAEGLTQKISASSDKTTVFNMTNHTYFNLDGKSILNHQLQIDADEVIILDHDLIGIDHVCVQKTAFDFNCNKLINSAKIQGDSQFALSKFIDHPFKLNGKLVLSTSELSLEITTDQEYVIVYCGNYLGSEKKQLKDNMNKDYHAICLETQAIPGKTELVNNYQSITHYKIDVCHK